MAWSTPNTPGQWILEYAENNKANFTAQMADPNFAAQIHMLINAAQAPSVPGPNFTAQLAGPPNALQVSSMTFPRFTAQSSGPSNYAPGIPAAWPSFTAQLPGLSNPAQASSAAESSNHAESSSGASWGNIPEDFDCDMQEDFAMAEALQEEEYTQGENCEDDDEGYLPGEAAVDEEEDIEEDGVHAADIGNDPLPPLTDVARFRFTRHQIAPFVDRFSDQESDLMSFTDEPRVVPRGYENSSVSAASRPSLGPDRPPSANGPNMMAQRRSARNQPLEPSGSSSHSPAASRPFLGSGRPISANAMRMESVRRSARNQHTESSGSSSHRLGAAARSRIRSLRKQPHPMPPVSYERYTSRQHGAQRLSENDAKSSASPNGFEEGLTTGEGSGASATANVFNNNNLQQLGQEAQASTELGLAQISIDQQSGNELVNLDSRRYTTSTATMDVTNAEDVFYTFQVVPRSYDEAKRKQLLHIFRYYAPYIPKAVTLSDGDMIKTYYHPTPKPVQKKVPAPKFVYIEPPVGPRGQGWPQDDVPVEVMEKLVRYLPRDTLQTMRLVNHEFEKKVSGVAFKTVVVPFRPEIYAMVVHESKSKPKKVDVKGKGKAKATDDNDYDDDGVYALDSYNQIKVKDVYDGMKVFEAWGSHIKQFAMTFEIDDVTLMHPPPKQTAEIISSYWGDYIWPIIPYSRYQVIEELEKKADEARCMTIALSKLTEVYELGLSVDSGLGWLAGPDISDRAKLFKAKPKVFGTKYLAPDTKVVERQQKWDSIVYRLRDALDQSYSRGSGRQVFLVPGEDPLNQTELLPIFGVEAAAPAQHVEPTPRLVLPNEKSPEARSTGILFSTALLPSDLTTAQMEWLMETEWAQRAFLASYCLALIDNSATFQHVRTLTISRLSSRYLVVLERQDIWAALPALDTLTVLVSADWRTVEKSAEGFITTPQLHPSFATIQFRGFLSACVMNNKNITTLRVGWVGGGEHAPGMCARNKHVLPAPVMDLGELKDGMAYDFPILIMLYIHNLTFENCWFTPIALKELISKMKFTALQTLTLDSVSLTADPRSTDVDPPSRADLILQTSVWPIGPHYAVLYPNNTVACYGDGGFSVPKNPYQRGLLVKCNNPPDPNSTAYLARKPRQGSWGDVIEATTPGETLAYKKYLNAIKDALDGPPARNRPGSLTTITFASCGYVRLVNIDERDFNQDAVGPTMTGPPPCLQKRFEELSRVMMSNSADAYLGQVVPSLVKHEQEILQNGFGMRLGWEGEIKWENLEDGQPEGGRGRFSGVVGVV